MCLPLSVTLALALLALPAVVQSASAAAPAPVVIAEEAVYTLEPPNNGSGPMWSAGCTSILRTGDGVVVSQMETGKDVPLLCNTRWRLLRRTGSGWDCFAEADSYRQREPASLATTGEGALFLNVNDSIEEAGVKYGRTKPHLLRFNFPDPAPEGVPLVPSWRGEPYFTDHSYRGYGADPARSELLMLNIDAKTSVEHATLMSGEGDTLANGAISFPIRSCYPQVGLENRAVHVLAIGDIVEPVEAWRAYKKEQTGNDWDYVFRILHYAWTPDITKEDFRAPIEVANVDATSGHIWNQDLWVSPGGEAYLLYSEREVASALMRDKFFPGKSIIDSLYLAIVKEGVLGARRELIHGTESMAPGGARFHETPHGTLYAVVYVSGPEAGNKLLRIHPTDESNTLIPIPLERPFSSFSLASKRAGVSPSNTIDLLGQEGNTLYYAEVALPSS